MLGLLLAAFLSGCAVGPDFAAPDAPLGAGYAVGKPANVTQSAAIAGGGAQRLVPGRDIPGEWWRLFRSKQISALVAEAVNNHPNIAAAEAALRQARETTEADVGSFFPSATLTQSVARTQMTTAQFGGLGQSSSSSGSQSSSSSGPTALIYTLHNSNVAVSFTPDVFGKTMRTVESDVAAAEYQRFQLEATYLALTANVVTAAIADSSYASQIKVTRDTHRRLSEATRHSAEALRTRRRERGRRRLGKGARRSGASDAAAARKGAGADAQSAHGLSRPLSQ